MEHKENSNRDITEVPAIGVSYSVQVGDGKSMVFQTHVPQGIEQDGLDGLVDKFHAAAERQVTYSKIDAAQHELQMCRTQMRDLALQIKSAEAAHEHKAQLHAQSGRKGAYSLPESELAAKGNAEKNMVRQINAEEEILAKLAGYYKSLEK